MRWSKNKQKNNNIQLHIFLAQVKRHGLVVVSGMALGGIQGNIEGYIVWISIALHRNTFNFSQVAGIKQSRCRWCFVVGEKKKNSQAADVTGLASRKKTIIQRHQLKIHKGECFTEANLQTNIQLRLFLVKNHLHQPARDFPRRVTCPTHSRGTKTSQTNEYLSFK